MIAINSKSYLRLDSTEYTYEQVQSMPVNRLKEMELKIKDNVADIAQQQKATKGDFAHSGISGDWDWYKKADFAKRVLIRWEHEVHNIITEKKQAHGAEYGKTFERHYINMAKEVIAPAQDRIIRDMVHSKMQEEGFYNGSST